ncbi:MAG: GFA family protein [Alphaproteobacteria bacterium]|nr:GFA family protein [Alphaproteobacteria bacterium]
MQIDGRCLCGLITYEATIDPDRVAICHCTDCQVHSGSAFRWVAQISKEDFRLLSGHLKTYVKTAQSGSKRAQLFCPECGTSLYGTDAADPQTFSLRLGTARQARELTPGLQIWRRSALGWASGIETKMQFDEQPPLRQITGKQ